MLAGTYLSAEFSRQYFFGQSVDADWCVGGRIEYRAPDGARHVEGEILDYDPPNLLRITWRVPVLPGLARLPEARMSYRIESAGERVIRLTMREEHPTPIDARLLGGGRSGWLAILSARKSRLETGSVPKIVPPGIPSEMMEYIKEQRT